MRGEPACRPGSVHPRGSAGRRPSIWDCRCRQPRAVYPRASGGPPSTARAGPAPRKARGPCDLAPGGVYQAARITPGAGGLLHHRFTLTPAGPEPGRGGLFSVALSRGSPRVGVTDHLALWSPDLPRRVMAAMTRRDRPADSLAVDPTIGARGALAQIVA